MDKSVSRSLLFRCWNVAAGLLTVALVPFYLTSIQLGFYYSFSSLIALQLFFELGLGQVLLFRFASTHQQASDHGGLYLDNLASLLYAARILYRILAILFFIFALPAGLIFFGSVDSQGVEWHLPWALLVLATSINLSQSVKLVFLEAVGDINHVAVARLRTGILSTIAFLVVLLCGGGLWAASAFPCGTAILMSSWLYRHRNASSYVKARLNHTGLNSKLLSLWMTDILPMQWRISLSWLSGFFIFQLYNPIALSRFGPELAGRIGYTASIISALSVIASTFTTALAPKLAALFAAGKIAEFNKVFDRSASRSIVAMCILLFAFPITVYASEFLNLAISAKILSAQDSLVYSLGSILLGSVTVLSIYLRSQQKEPLVAVSVVTAVLITPALIVGSSYSLAIMLLSSLAVIAFSFIWSLLIYSSNRRSLKAQI